MQKDKLLTISIDDGHPTDLKAAALLKKYGLKATFYIPKTNPEREVLSEAQIVSLAKDFEIGGHTLSHMYLTKLSPIEAEKEILEGKKWLENLLGKKVDSFCYPGGKFNSFIKQIVQKAGFLGARNSFFNCLDFPASNRFECGVSTHAYSHGPMVQIRHALLEGNWAGLKNFFKIYHFEKNWVNHFLKSVDHVEKNGGVAHLFFHSWEIEAAAQWETLEKLFANLSTRTTLERVTNGEVFRLGS